MATKKTHSASSAQTKIPVSKKLHFSKREALDFGFEASKKNIIYFISLLVVIVLVNGGLGFLQVILGEENSLLFLVLQLVRVIVGIVISMGVIKIVLEFIDNKKPQLSDIFYTKSIINYVLVSIIKTVIVFVGFLLLIIPGIIFSIKLQFATYLVVDKNMGVVDALNKSWEMTKGVKWNLFLFSILLVLIDILGFMALIVGLFITIPLTMVATAYVYRKLLSQVS